MEFILQNKTDCCGCTACYNVCPVSAITMQADEEGFLYPEISTDKCIDCGKCKKVCPVLNAPQLQEEPPKSYIARTKDMDMLKNSASGGFIYALSKYMVNDNAKVFGVSFDDSLKVRHSMADTVEKLGDFSGSKYVQSDLGDIFKTCQKLLKSDEKVMFIGTPCQVAGLKSYLQKDYENLVTADFVCHGVPSPYIWEEYKKVMENEYNSKIKNCNFRDKKYGYRSTVMSMEFESGEKYYASPRVDMMLKSFYKDAINRPSCENCKFKTLNRVSDFTCYDSWRAESIEKSCKDDNKGYTNVFAQSQKAEKILDKISSNIEIVPTDLDKIVPVGGGMILKSAKSFAKRKEFWQTISGQSFKQAFDNYLPVSSSDMRAEKVKDILHKTGVLSVISKVKRKIKDIKNSKK